jgi:hypothetical protein
MGMGHVSSSKSSFCGDQLFFLNIEICSQLELNSDIMTIGDLYTASISCKTIH